MNTRYGLTLPLAGMLVLAGLSLTAEGEPMRGGAPVEEGTGFAVSMNDFRGVLQERAGYAFTLGHYVGQHRAVRDELERWRQMVAELSGMEPPNRMASAYHAARQERRGYQVATDTLVDRRHGVRQELLGHQVALAHALRAGRASPR